MTGSSALKVDSRVWADLTEALGAPKEGVSTRPLLELVKECFWASLRPEEGRYPRIALVLIPRDSAHAALVFGGQGEPLTREALGKLATIVAPGSHLCVDGKRAWGITSRLPEGAIQVRAVAPGHVIVQRGPDRLAVFRRGRSYSLVKESTDGVLHGVLPMQGALLLGRVFLDANADPQLTWQAAIKGSLVLMVGDLIRSHRTGGMIVLVPSREGAWTQSVKSQHPVDVTRSGSHSLGRHVTRISNGPRAANDVPRDIDFFWTGSLSEVDSALMGEAAVIAGLGRLDGAVVLDSDLNVLAFGAKLLANDPDPSELLVTSPTQLGARRAGKTEGRKVKWDDYGRAHGTRHQSALRFVWKHQDASAVILSQDGCLSIVAVLASGELAVFEDFDMLFD